ncbi:MAG: cytochrome c oxidase assembly protein, partial [Terrimicrobiaceae bacterium]
MLGSWNLEVGVVFALLVSAFIYLRGWRSVSRLAPARFPAWRAACFLGGLLAVFVAVCSPLDAFASWLLSVHMVQHLLLTMVAPPLVLLGAPFLPVLSGLPRR